VINIFMTFETLATTPMVNQTKKKNAQPLVERLICELPLPMVGHDIPRHGAVQIDVEGAQFQFPYEVRLCKLKRTEEEKRKARRNYTKEYIRRPEVKAKIHARMNDPEKIKARKLYAAKEEVKTRKRQLNALKRVINNKIKEEHPELYDDIKSRALVQKEEE